MGCNAAQCSGEEDQHQGAHGSERERDGWTDLVPRPLGWLLLNPFLTGPLGEAKLGYQREREDGLLVPGTGLGSRRGPEGQLCAHLFL